GDAHGIEKIERTIAADAGPRAHRTDHDYRLVRFDRELEEIRRFFERGGAVRHHRTGDVRRGERGVDRFGQLEQNLRINSAATDVRDIFVVDLGDGFELGEIVDEFGG